MTTYNRPYDEDSMTEAERNQVRLEQDETGDLISSEKVDGTKVVNRDGEELGSIHHFMVGKRDGKVRYVVMSYGGLFGMGEHYYPLPWDSLTYDEELDGYKVDVDRERLRDDKPPSFRRDEEPKWNREFDEQIRIYYLGVV